MPLEVEGPAPPRGGPKVEVWRVTTTTPQDFIVISRTAKAVWVHFGKRSSECLLELDGFCEKCERATPRKWKGYLDVIRLADNKRCFLEITPPAWTQLKAQVLDDSDLRGRYITVSKSAGGPKGRYRVLLTNTTAPAHSLADPDDVMPILRILWSWGLQSGQAAT